MVRSDRPLPSATEETHFGFTNIPIGEKQQRVDDVFHKVASRYDLMNDLMSAGLHRLWKDVLVSKIRPSRTRPFHHLDVAGGTCDVAFRVAAAGGPLTEVTVLDINGDMLAVGRDRAAKRAAGEKLRFVQGNAEDLPFADRPFDAYSIAFGIRNVPRIERALAEAFRVLKIGGHFLCLEFSHVDMPLLAGSTKLIPSRRFRRSARSSPATARPIAISSSRSASFPTPKHSVT